MKKSAAALLIVITLSSCIGPNSRKEKLAMSAEPCLADVTVFSSAMACLQNKGYKSWRHYQKTTNYQNCGPYWGYPFVASCSGIIIEHEGEQIKSYKLWATTDGI